MCLLAFPLLPVARVRQPAAPCARKAPNSLTIAFVYDRADRDRSLRLTIQPRSRRAMQPLAPILRPVTLSPGPRGHERRAARRIFDPIATTFAARGFAWTIAKLKVSVVRLRVLVSITIVRRCRPARLLYFKRAYFDNNIFRCAAGSSCDPGQPCPLVLAACAGSAVASRDLRTAYMAGHWNLNVHKRSVSTAFSKSLMWARRNEALRARDIKHPGPACCRRDLPVCAAYPPSRHQAARGARRNANYHSWQAVTSTLSLGLSDARVIHLCPHQSTTPRNFFTSRANPNCSPTATNHRRGERGRSKLSTCGIASSPLLV